MDLLKPIRRRIKVRNKLRREERAMAMQADESSRQPSKQPYLVPADRLDTYHHFDLDGIGFSTLQALFEKTAEYWRTEATAPDQIYWSVMTNPAYLKALDENERRAFLETGRDPVARIEEIFRQWWEGEGTPDVMDFGCGVGRLAVHTAAFARRVHCADFSEAHLAEARRNLADFSDGSAEPVPLKDISSLDALPDCDLIYSLITLQHNTPPVIAHITARLLDALRPGGVAILHVPLAHAGYIFDPARYLASPDAGQTLEMHILPKNNLNEIGRRTGCAMVASHGMGGTGDLYSEWIVYRRPAAA